MIYIYHYIMIFLSNIYIYRDEMIEQYYSLYSFIFLEDGNKILIKDRDLLADFLLPCRRRIQDIDLLDSIFDRDEDYGLLDDILLYIMKIDR